MKTQGQIDAFNQYEGKLSKLFAMWEARALAATVLIAKDCIARHGGDISAAQEAISPLAYGNVSIACSSYWQPVDKVMGAMALGYT